MASPDFARWSGGGPVRAAALACVRTWGGDAALLVALAALPVLPSLFAPFFADDYLHVEAASKLPGSLKTGWVLPIESGGAWWTPRGLCVEYFRPLVVLSFALDRIVYGLEAAGYHLTNLALHATCTILFWSIARRIVRERRSAWVAAALFAVHPCHTQAVAWISGRTDVLATVFFAAAFLLYLQSRPLRRATAARFALSLALFALSLCAKEMAITFPLVVLADTLIRPDTGQPPRRRFLAPALAALVAAGYAAVRISLLGGFHPPPPPFAYQVASLAFVRHVLTAPFLYLADFTLFVPADPMVTLPFWASHPGAFAGLAVVSVVALLNVLRHLGDREARAWSIAWTVLTLVPVVTLTVGEHFLYLPSMGYCMLFGATLPKPGTRRPRDRIALAATVAAVLAISVGRTIAFGVVASSSSRAIDQTLAAIDRAPQATELLVADLPWAASLAYPHALRIERPGRALNVGILGITTAHGTEPFGRTAPPSATWVSRDRIAISRDEPFLESYVERALAGGTRALRPRDTIDRPGFMVIVVDAPGGRLRSFDVALRDPKRTLVLAGGKAGLTALWPGARQAAAGVTASWGAD